MSFKKHLIGLILFSCFALDSAIAQNIFYTRGGNITFFSSTPIEDIEARNYNVTSVINTKNGDMEFSVLIMAFEFKKSLMQEHFNEKFMESAEHPKAYFKGHISNFDKIDFSIDGSYVAEVSGLLTIHGVTQQINTEGIVTVEGEKINSTAKFKLKPADFKIKIPSVVKDNIAKVIDVTVTCAYEPFIK
ncbi:MAG: YceI family protein [Candidatus Cyclobacteriaceae bacterium M2_1C_046]